MEEIVADLGVPGIEHAVLRRRYIASTTLVERGAAIAELLDLLVLDEGLLSRVLAAGHRAGLWGRPRIHDVHLDRLVCPLSTVGRWRRGPPSVRS